MREVDRRILRLAVPALGALIAEPLFLATDTALVGHLGVDQLAALGVAATIIQTAIGLLVFLAYATTPAVARLLGSGERTAAVRAGIDGIWLALGIGVALAIVGPFVAHPLSAAFGASNEVTGLAALYVAISSAGVPAMLVVIAATGLLRGLQDTRTPLVIAVAGFGANALLNAALIYGAGWGIAGSAIGTVAAQWGMAAACLAIAVRHARRTGASVRPGLPGVASAARAGGWMLLRTLTLRIALVATTVAAASAGTVTLASTQVLFQLTFLLALALDAFAIAAQAIVGHDLGTGDRDAVRALVRRLLLWGLGSGVALGVVLAIASPWLGAVFSGNAGVIAAVPAGALVVAVTMPLAAVVFVLDGVLIGSADGHYLALAGLVNLVVYLPLLWLAAQVPEGSEVAGAGAAVLAIQLAYCVGFYGIRALTLGVRAAGTRWMGPSQGLSARIDG
ncbi:MATE family efflux transporter [Homoserinibacter sp. GY 40078]|uniref:MATE family efflux transporter n=1 Tax=Homoserinibacter sp. GY 40078 TaxID=2603275 RepID=UPI0011C937B3|nr:MATE family efflux transporter [Homoserinibacter sp. GY 40078]TXK18836.1 MATE family efflux transporter [Homoserinibacter sp. GY 40078]